MSRPRKLILLVMALIGLTALTASSCEATSPLKEEQERQNQAYDQMIEGQPALIPEYSSDRENINFWVETWGMEPGKAAYVYLLTPEGKFIGYYVMEGLPTSKCKMATPTWDFDKPSGWDTEFLVPAPGLSGTYGSGAGECNTYYGKDYSSGSYMEFTVNEMTMMTFAQPLPLPEGVEAPIPLGFTDLEDM